MRGGILCRPYSTRSTDTSQVSDNTGYYSEYDNVEDFIEHYLIRMADRYAEHGRDDVADAIYDALDQYMTKQVGIRLVDGQVYLVPLEIMEVFDDEDANDT
jgi:hypothetical protein